MEDMEPECLDCCEWPEHLTEEILKWLPLQSLCKFRLVCKQWNAIISSTKFVTTQWAEAPCNRNPWLVVQWLVLRGTESRMPYCLAYCFFTQTWKKNTCVSLSFLREQEGTANYVKYCFGSATGLFLVGGAVASGLVVSNPLTSTRTSLLPPPFSSTQRIVVSNPLTRTSLQLPPFSSIQRICSVGIMGGEGDSQDTYQVVVVGKSSPRNTRIVEIYHSARKIWNVVGPLPEDMWIEGTGTARGTTMGIDLVFSNRSFYSLSYKGELASRGELGIMGFSIREGTSIFSPFPKMFKEKVIIPYLLACGSQLLLIGCIVKIWKERVKDVIIWEFGEVSLQDVIIRESSSSSSSSSRWKEIARMPPAVLESVNGTPLDIECPIVRCVGVGDHACLIVNGHSHMIEVVVYNISEKTWSMLPSYPLNDDIWEGYITAFEPRPDMKPG